MVRPNCVDLLDLVAERSSLVDDELKELMGRGLPRKLLKLPVNRQGPRKENASSNLGIQLISINLTEEHSSRKRTMIAPIGSRSTDS